MVVAKEPRARCARCRRPTIVCYCAALPRIDTTTKVVILQHPRERDVPIGTARMATLCLPHSELHVGVRWHEHARLAELVADPARPAILLYPGEGAKNVLAEPPQGRVTLIVVDGTWSQAKTVVRDNPVLQALPRYAFETPEPSHYRIRKEPRAEYCSTIEAVMHVLGALEGAPDRFRALLDPFHAMVDAQLAAQATRPLRPMQTRDARPPVDRRTRLPPILRERYQDLVLVVSEANAWPYHVVDKPADELIQLSSIRPATGEVFDRILAPAGALAPSTCFHTQISEARLRAGDSLADVMAAWNAFAGPRAVVAAWGHYSPDLIRAAGGTIPDKLDLRAAAQRALHLRLGSLETYASTLGPTQPSLAIGRAGRRLAALAQVLASWRS